VRSGSPSTFRFFGVLVPPSFQTILPVFLADLDHGVEVPEGHDQGVAVEVGRVEMDQVIRLPVGGEVVPPATALAQLDVAGRVPFPDELPVRLELL